MTAAPLEGQNCPPTPSLILLDTPRPLACLHCAATQATVLRDRQIPSSMADLPVGAVIERMAASTVDAVGAAAYAFVPSRRIRLV
jgi:hypothetical protein